MTDLDARIYVAGHTGMVGSAIVRRLQTLGYRNIIARSRAELDLVNQQDVERFFRTEEIDQVVLAAARVGGIHANNTFPADFIYDNLMIQTNVIQAAHRADIQRLLFLGSSCIYPRHDSQPMQENCLLTGTLEPTNEPYAIAKIAGIKLCESLNRQYGRDYRSLMPTNLYGPGDNYHAENSHVIPALLRRFHEARIGTMPEVVVWGTGRPRREFLHVDDLADACTHVMALPGDAWRRAVEPMCSHVNVGTGVDCSIGELAALIAKVVGYLGPIRFDTGKPDGAPRKLLDISRIRQLGWKPAIELETGLAGVYEEYRRG